MARQNDRIEHLLRRAAFGGSPAEVAELSRIGYQAAVDLLVFYEQTPDDVDERIGVPGHVGVTTRGQFSPETSIADARQRWLFRMVHSRRPLQEKMALFWHHHFATAHQKVADTYGGIVATRMMAATEAYNGPNGSPAGQIELFRRHALGNFYDLLVAVARDPAMLVWLDGRLNVRGTPQENFAREVMELFTMGIRPSDDAPSNYTEDDVKAAARVFTGWNLSVGARGSNNVNDATLAYSYLYRADRHDTGPKSFSFDVSPGGGRTIASNGEQEGLDFLLACCRHPQTGPRLARKLYAFFVSELQPAPQSFVNRVAATFYSTSFDMRRVILQVMLSSEFQDESNYYTRYAWPVELTYAFSSPNTGNEALYARQVATRIAWHVPVDRPHLSFVSGTTRAAFDTLDRVASVAQYAPTVTYPATGLGSALRAVAGSMVRGIGTRVFWVQTGGFDTHASQNPNQENGAYYRLMATMNDAVLAFYTDMRNQGLLNDTLVLQFSEFGRRVYENGSQGTDHGAASTMMLLGGGVNGGLYGTAPDLRDTPGNPTLESANGDVRYQTDFRSVYARVLDGWLGTNSETVLDGNFRNPGLTFI